MVGRGIWCLAEELFLCQEREALDTCDGSWDQWVGGVSDLTSARTCQVPPFPELHQTLSSRQVGTVLPSFLAQRQTNNNIKNKNNDEEEVTTSRIVPIPYQTCS